MPDIPRQGVPQLRRMDSKGDKLTPLMTSRDFGTINRALPEDLKQRSGS